MSIWVKDGQKLYEAEVDSLAMAIRGEGVLSGCDVVAKNPVSMNVDVQAGVCTVGDKVVNVAATTLTVSASDPTNPRRDIVYVGTNGVPVIATGAPAAIPKPPTLPASSIYLGLVEVPAGATTISSTDIFDRRMVLPYGSPDQPTTLSHGLNLIETDQVTALKTKLYGRTLVNLLGKNGNCEDTSKFPSIFGTAPTDFSLDTTNKLYGSSSFKYIFSGTSSYRGKTINPLTSGKSYLLVADVRSNNGIVGAKVSIRKSDMTYIQGVSITNTTFAVSYRTFTSSADEAYIGFYAEAGDGVNHVNIDGIRLYEITSAEKIAIDAMLTADAQAYIAEKYPYVDSVQHVQNPYIKKCGKNLLPPFTSGEWTLHANAKVIGDYELQLDATGDSQLIMLKGLPCKPNTTYTLSCSDAPRIAIAYLDENQIYITENNSTNGTVTATTPSNARFIQINLSNGLNGAGTFTFTNPMLNLGATTLSFEPQNNDYLYFPTKLASNVDGTIKDEVYERDGKWWHLKRFKSDVALDGSWVWTSTIDGAGFKRVYMPTPSNMISDNIAGNKHISKYNGTALKDVGVSSGITSQDQFGTNGSASFQISIADTDSGWGETYTPTAQEIQAYFNGYKMNNGVFGTSYNGSGTKTWVPWNATDNTGAVTVVPTTPSTAITSGVYDYYRLTYQLANVDEKEISPEGAITLHEGANQVELGEGVIIREQATPILSGSNYVINDSAVPTSSLKYNAQKIIAVYRGTDKDNAWVISADGKEQKATIPSGSYDNTKQYLVTYLALDKYLLSTNILQADCTYNTNMKTVLDDTVQKVADLSTRQSVHENYFNAVGVKGEGEVIQSGNASATGAITFKRAYKSAPVVIVSSKSGTLAYPTTVTTTGFTLNGAAAYWIAIGK